MSKKVWSISTTLRNPERTRDFLITLSEMEGKVWEPETQCEFQIRLIKNRFYGTESSQFLKTLSEKSKSIMENLTRELTYTEAEEIFYEKEYEEPAMRGRTSFAP